MMNTRNFTLRNVKHMAVALAVGIIMTGCESDESNGVGFEEDNSKNVAVTQGNVEKVKKIFYSIPSTIEMASMIKRSGASYNNELLNDINNVSNYTSSKSKAINLGIYGADLSYTSIFNRNQESVFYLSCSKQLAEQLDISNALSDDLLDRIQEQVEDREALTDIVTETYWSLDSYLKDNGREELSTMMVTGGWLEGLYLSTQIYLEGNADEELQQRIVDQGFALEHLIQLVESHEGMGSMLDLRTDLMSISDLYKQSQTEYQESTGDSDGVTVIGGPKYTMTNLQLDDLAGLVKEIRTKYVS